METRIYLVRRMSGDTIAEERLVRASHRTAALRHVVEGTHLVEVASQSDLERMLPTGAKVELPESDRQLSLVD